MGLPLYPKLEGQGICTLVSTCPTAVFSWESSVSGYLSLESSYRLDAHVCLLWSPHLPAWEGSSFWWKHPALKRKPQPTGSIVIHDLQRLTPSPKTERYIRYRKCPGTRKAIWNRMGRWRQWRYFYIFFFCWSSSYYPVLLSVPQGKHFSRCHKWPRKIKWMTTIKFLGRKDKGQKLLHDAVWTVGREETKQSQSWRKTSWE